MDERNYRKPHEGWPHVRFGIDEQGREFGETYGRVIDPDDLRWAEGMTLASMVLGCIGLVYLLSWLGPPIEVGIGIYVIALFLYFPVNNAWLQAYRTDFCFRFTQDSFRSGGARPYDMRIPHGFEVEPHIEAENEAREIEFKLRAAQHNRQLINPKRYYGDSYHVVLSYDGCSKYLLTVYGREDARAIREKLQYLDARFMTATSAGRGDGRKPEDQWGESTSGLPG